MNPSITQVLAQGGVSHHINLGGFAALLAVVCVTVFSAAKGLELYRKKQYLLGLAETEPDLTIVAQEEKNEKLNFLVNELKRETERQKNQNLELRCQLNSLEGKKLVEEALRKSNASLSKECEKLKAENESLIIKNTPVLLEPKIKPEKKATTKKVLAKRSGGGRKLKRVSNKKK